jgi:uncharacterized protein
MSNAAYKPVLGIPSPCISVCVMDGSGLCTGCLRTIDEIASWGALSNTSKTIILRVIEARRAKIS